MNTDIKKDTVLCTFEVANHSTKIWIVYGVQMRN